AVAVLEQHREPLEVGEARLLHRCTFAEQRRGKALSPLSVSRMRSKQQRETRNGPALLPPRDEAFDEPLLVGSVRGRVAHDEDDGPRQPAAEAAAQTLD